MGETKGKTLNSKSAVKFVSDHAIIFLIILLAIITWANSQNFLSADNVGNLISNVAPRFIIACGVSGCLITKGTDLSAGRQVGLAACFAAMMQQTLDYSARVFDWMPDMPWFVSLLITLAIMACFGAVNGCVIAFLKVPPFIATLGMQTLVYGICQIITGNQPIGGFKESYRALASGNFFSSVLGRYSRLLPYLLLPALLVGLFMWFLYNKTRHGKYMYAIGGVSVNGGVGKVSGILIGVLVFEVLKICLQFLRFDPAYTFIAQGLVIIVAVALDLRKYLAKK